MEIVAHGVLVGEALQNWNIAILHVVKRHGIAAAVVIDVVGYWKAVGINFAGVGGNDEWIEVVEASGRILARGVADVASGLLPHFEEAVRGVSGIRIVGEVRAGQWERSVGKVIEIIYPRIEIGEFGRLGGTGSAGGQQVEIGRFQRRLDGGQKRSRRARRKRRRLTGGGAGRKVQAWFGECVVGSLLVATEADVERRFEWRNGLELLGLIEMTAGSAIRVDDSFGEQILDGFAALGDVGGEEVIKGAVLADQDDDVLDGGAGVRIFLGLKGCCQRTTQTELENGQRDESNAKPVQRFCDYLFY